MDIDISIKIGGEAGQGIQTVGDLLANVCREAGLYIAGINDFESRIRGGHSYFQIRICSNPVAAPVETVHLVVALNEQTYELHRQDIHDGGLIIMDAKDGAADNVVPVAIRELATQAGGRVMANTVAVGAVLGLLGAPFHLLEGLLVKRFSRKSQEIVDNNITAARLGFEAVKGVDYKWAFDWNRGQPKGTLINGSKAIALGALAGDCRFAAFYPMSPATSIMQNLNSYASKIPMVVEQVEDEIAAVNAIIGASYAGARSMTSTSGGGFSLMVEGLGLAGITETPIVIINAQRPGPATGLPTRTAQPDLQFVIRASQDEFPRFVFAPGTPGESFDATVRAFDLAYKYQVPAIVLTDQYLSDSLYIEEKPFEVPERIESYLVGDEDMADPLQYKRYALTKDGISPRALPCKGEALVVASGNEHTEDGHISEDSLNRVQMVDKRNAKIPDMIAELNPPEASYEESDLVLVGWGSTRGVIREAVDILRKEGLDIGCLHFTDLWPFPTKQALSALKKSKQFIMVEQNMSAQLGQLIREQTGLSYDRSILKYDGRPFYTGEIVERVKQIKEQAHGEN
jgi:2-oxoglutarate/2-oxoacid ferredoxin oxidoreductase subunit alpha